MSITQTVEQSGTTQEKLNEVSRLLNDENTLAYECRSKYLSKPYGEQFITFFFNNASSGQLEQRTFMLTNSELKNSGSITLLAREFSPKGRFHSNTFSPHYLSYGFSLAMSTYNNAFDFYLNFDRLKKIDIRINGFKKEHISTSAQCHQTFTFEGIDNPLTITSLTKFYLYRLSLLRLTERQKMCGLVQESVRLISGYKNHPDSLIQKPWKMTQKPKVRKGEITFSYAFGN